jgi:hypothetical protein
LQTWCLKDTRFNLQEERVYIRNIEYIMPKQQAYMLFYPNMCFQLP